MYTRPCGFVIRIIQRAVELMEHMQSVTKPATNLDRFRICMIQHLLDP